jgi:hypothetical protein
MDAYINNIVSEMKISDNSFKEPETMLSLLFGGHKYTQSEAREIWFSGIAVGLEEGLRRASLEGQRIQINSNMQNERQKEFYEKFLRLAQEYKCQIQYHPHFGMCVIDRNYNQ